MNSISKSLLPQRFLPGKMLLTAYQRALCATVNDYDPRTARAQPRHMNLSLRHTELLRALEAVQVARDDDWAAIGGRDRSADLLRIPASDTHMGQHQPPCPGSPRKATSRSRV